MEDIAVQLFKLGDQEHKGFIVKRDMQRLQSEVSLPPDQLEAVFESLDSSHAGYLTLDQFLAGVNHLSGAEEPEVELPEQQLLSLNVLHKSGELMCEVRGLVRSEETWHQLLAALFSDLNQLLRQISQLEDTLRARDHNHQEELRSLYEELETQLSEERDRLHKQLQQREAVLKAELGAELAAKEQQIAELVQQQDELQDRLQQAQSKLNAVTRNTPAAKDQEERGERRLEAEQSRRHAVLEAQHNYAEGFSHAYHLATLHEEGLVKQLKLLQDMQETLKPGLKESRRRHFCYDDL